MEQQAKELLRKAREVRSRACVTITLNTHRTRPDSLQDPIRLKDLLRTAQARLEKEHGSAIAAAVMARLNALASDIDHAHNKDSLVLFASEDFAGRARLSVPVIERITLDEVFATRDLFRALHEETAYYVLLLNRGQARLFQALKGKLEEEAANGFPLSNNVSGADAVKQLGDREAGVVKEFFNRVDKALLQVVHAQPLPVVLAAERRNVDYYRAVADRPEFLKAAFKPSREDLSPPLLIAEAWEAFAPMVKQQQQERVAELEKAVSAGRLFSDLNDIWRNLQAGRGGTLFVKQGLFRPAMITEAGIEELPREMREKPGAMDDIIDEMIDINLAVGGDAVFISGNALDRFNGLALATRY